MLTHHEIIDHIPKQIVQIIKIVHSFELATAKCIIYLYI